MPDQDLLPVTDRRTPLLLAVYGTLRHGCRNAHLLEGAERVAEGVVTGTLHEVTSPLGGRAYGYPLLVVPGSGRVVVEVYRVTDGRMLRALDLLEAYDPDDPAGSEYVRVRVPLLGAGPGAPEEVQVYAHAGDPASRGAVLPGGDWRAHAGALA